LARARAYFSRRRLRDRVGDTSISNEHDVSTLNECDTSTLNEQDASTSKEQLGE